MQNNYKFKHIILNKSCLGRKQLSRFANEKVGSGWEDKDEKLQALGDTLLYFLWFWAGSRNSKDSKAEDKGCPETTAVCASEGHFSPS